MFNDNFFIKMVNSFKFKKKEKESSLIMELLNNPDLAEINMKKEGEELVIRIKKAAQV